VRPDRGRAGFGPLGPVAVATVDLNIPKKPRREKLARTRMSE
jgi:hypothetical protein